MHAPYLREEANNKAIETKKMSYNPGDLIYYLTVNKRQKYYPNRIGIIISKTYQAYNEKYSRYDVYWIARGETVELTSHSIRHINNEA